MVEHGVADLKCGQVEKDAGGPNSTTVLNAYVSRLKAAIDTGAYVSQKADWVKCVNIKTAVRVLSSPILFCPQ